MTELPRKNYSANLDYTSSPKVLALGAVYTCGAWGRPVGEVLWIGISSHKRRMWLFPHPYCPWTQQKTVQAKETGVHLRAPCCHSTNESGWTSCTFPNVHFLSDHFAFPIVSLSPGKKAAGLLFCQPAAKLLNQQHTIKSDTLLDPSLLTKPCYSPPQEQKGSYTHSAPVFP